MSNIILFYVCFLNLFANSEFISKLKYLIYIFIFVFCFLDLIKNFKNIKIEKNNLVILFFIFMMSTIPSSLAVINIKNTNDILFSYVRVWMLLPIVMYIYRNINIIQIINMIIKFSFIINLISFVQIINNINDFGRIQSVFSHPNFYAFYLIIIILSLIYFINIKKIKKNIGIIYLILNIFFMVSAGSKTAFLALGCAILYMFVKFIIKTNGFLKIPLIITTLFILILSIIIFKNKFSELRVFNMNYGLETNQINSFAWRILNWKSKFEVFDYSNIFTLLFGLGWDSEILYGFKGFAMHNEYLRILFESGILGSFMIILFIKAFINKVRLIKNNDFKKIYICILIVILIGAFSENIFVAAETTVLYLSLIFSINLSINFKLKEGLLDER
ncbi:TPA: hypothetical protein I9010_001809 [Clostridium perfringens]|nr:hypothetical protein [Clostridium perfringens]